MSISSSLSAGVSGLTASATRLSAISDNIANSETPGYKRTVVDFSSLVLDQSPSSYSAGGVTSFAFKDVSETSSLIGTTNSTDLSVSGRGLLPVTTEAGLSTLSTNRDLMLLPTGSFNSDENGNLRTESGLFLLGWPVDANGDIGTVSRNSGADLEPVNISATEFTASPTENIRLGVNLPATATESGATVQTYEVPVEYFDNLGRTQSVTLEFTPTVPGSGSSNNWTAEIFDQGGDPLTSIGSLDITFNDTNVAGGSINSVSATNGATYDAATGEISLTLSHGNVSVFIGQPNDAAGLSQLAGPFSPANVTKDGTPIGDLTAIEVDDDGFLQAIYNTGFRRTLYQIPVGDVANMNGLNAQDSQAYSVSSDSGNVYFWDAGTGPAGTVSGFSLAESRTDIAQELTDLIETQRAYSSNAKIVQTVDEMLEETTNLKR